MTDTAEISDTDLRAMAQAIDAGQPVPTPAAPPASGAPSPEPSAPATGQPPASGEDAPPAGQAEPPSPPAPKPAEQPPKPDSAFAKARKEAERRAVTWQEIKARKDELDATDARLKQERAELDRQRAEIAARAKPPAPAAPAAPGRDADGYTVEDYLEAARRFEDEGNSRLAQQARDRARTLRETAAPAAPAPAAPTAPVDAFTTPEFQTKWRATAAALVQADPELSKPDNPVVQSANALVAHPQWGALFRSSPDGLRAAVEVAKLQIQANAATAASKELATAKAEIARLNKLLQPHGSLPAGAAPGEKRPDTMTAAELDAYALDLARRLDRGETVSG